MQRDDNPQIRAVECKGSTTLERHDNFSYTNFAAFRKWAEFSSSKSGYAFLIASFLGGDEIHDRIR